MASDEADFLRSNLIADCDWLTEKGGLTADELTPEVVAILVTAAKGVRQGRLDLYGLHEVLERLVTELEERGYEWSLHEELEEHGVSVDQRQRNANGADG